MSFGYSLSATTFDPKTKDLEIKLTARQGAAYQALEDPNIFEVLYGGAKGGGKSVFGCLWVYLLCKKIIAHYDLKRTDRPPLVGFMGRLRGADFRDTTLRTFLREIPASEFELIESRHIIRINNAAEIQYGGFDDREAINKFNSAEFFFAFIDQAEEVPEEDISILLGAMRGQINGKAPPWGYKALYTANPDICWLADAFVNGSREGGKFVKALYTDNPFLPENYGETLDRAFAFNPKLKAAYKYGDWAAISSAYSVMNRDDVWACINNQRAFDDKRERLLTVADIAEDGDDETVIYDMRNTEIVSEEIYSHIDLMETCGRIQAHALRNKSDLICVDKIGLGGGVYARLVEVYRNDQMKIYGFDGRVSPPEDGISDITYANYRAYSWFKAERMIRERKVTLPHDNVLLNQLGGVTYKFTSEKNGKIILDKKEDLKVRLRKSPDRADAYVMGLDALDRTPVHVAKDKYASARVVRREFSPMAV